MSDKAMKDTEPKEAGGAEQTSLFSGPQARLSVSELIHPVLVTVSVGVPLREYQVPKGLICGQSAYFEKAFNGSFAEGHTNTIRLDDVEPDLFEVYLGWLYTQSLANDLGKREATTGEPPQISSDGNFQPDRIRSFMNVTRQAELAAEAAQGDSNAADPTTWSWHRLFQLYALGDKYDTRRFRTTVIEAIQIKANQIRPCKYFAPDLEALRYAFTSLPSTSQLYIYLLELITYDVKPLQAIQAYTALPVEVMLASWRMLKQVQDRKECKVCERYDKKCINEDCAICSILAKCADPLHGDFEAAPKYDNDYHAYHEHETEEEAELCRRRWDLICERRVNVLEVEDDQDTEKAHNT